MEEIDNCSRLNQLSQKVTVKNGVHSSDRLDELEGLSPEEMRKMIHELHAREQSYQSQFANNAAVMLLVDFADGSILGANTAAQQFYGYPQEQLLSMRIADITVQPTEGTPCCEISVISDRSKSLEFQHRLADGSVRDVEVSSTQVLFGERRLLHSIITDITDRKQAEKALRIQHDLSLALSSCNNIHLALEQILDAALRMESIDCGGIYLANSDGSLDLTVHRGLSPQFVENATHYSADAPHVRLAQGGQIHYGTYEKIVLELDATCIEESLCGLAIIPVLHQGQLLAVLNLASHTYGDIPANTRQMLETLAQQIGSALRRLRTDTALRESQQNLQALFDTIEDFLFVLDDRGCILKTNAATLCHLGYMQEELIGQDVLTVHPPDRRVEASAIIADMLADKCDFCPVPLQAKDGKLIPVETRVTAGVWNAKPALFGISRDITERKRAEKALQESEERYKQITETITDYIYTVRVADGHAVETTHGPGCLVVTGYRASEFANDSSLWLRMVAVEDRSEVEEQARRILAGENPLPIEHRIAHKNGTVRWVRNTFIPYRDRFGDLIAYDGLIQDITARKEAEEALRAAHWRLENIIEATHVGTWEWNIQTGETVFNAEWARILGYTLDELAPISIRTWEMFTHPDDIKVSDQLLSRHFSGEIPYYECECRMKHKDGYWVWVLDRGRVITRTDDGKPLMMFGTHMDITERKQAEEALRQAFDQIRTLRGIVPICMHCKKIRDDQGYWSQVEVYIRDHTEADFSHGICPECIKRLYPEYAEDISGNGPPSKESMEE